MDFLSNHLTAILVTFFFTSIIWYIVLRIYAVFVRRALRRELYIEAPMSKEEIEARIHMEKARADVRVAEKELTMAELRQQIAEYHAKCADQMTRMDLLHHEYELLQLELSGQKYRNEVAKFAEIGADIPEVKVDKKK
jgi:uncharacterized coiled-coil protein SlyX